MLIMSGAVVLLLSYDSMPQAVVLYRPPWNDAPIMGAKSPFTVGRIVLMGVGQLGAATAMVFVARGSAPWGRFWRWLGLTAGLKTLLECLAAGASRRHRRADPDYIYVRCGWSLRLERRCVVAAR